MCARGHCGRGPPRRSGVREDVPALALPFEAGQQVYSAGIHSDDGSTGVKNAVDFSPADGTVPAALAGTVRLQHRAGGDWVTVDHAGGRRTGYYHLEGIRAAREPRLPVVTRCERRLRM